MQQIYEKISDHNGNFNTIEMLGEGRDAEVKVESFDCDRGVYLTFISKSYGYEFLGGNYRRISAEPNWNAMAKKAYADRLQERKEWWLSRFYEKWGDFYDYSEMDFKSATKSIKVICKKSYHPPLNKLIAGDFNVRLKCK